MKIFKSNYFVSIRYFGISGNNVTSNSSMISNLIKKCEKMLPEDSYCIQKHWVLQRTAIFYFIDEETLIMFKLML